MADKHDQWADNLSAGPSGWLTGFLAEEDKIDRRMLWRLGSWGVAAVSAVVVAVLASQSQVQQRRDQVATFDMMTRQAQQLQFVAKETQTEARRLSLAIETLNSDRDRLYARVTSVEQGLDSVTGSIKRQVLPVATVAPPAVTIAAPEPAKVVELPSIPAVPLIGPVASAAPMVEAPPAKSQPPVSTPPTSAPLVASKSIMAPPDAAATKLREPSPPPNEPAAVAPAPDTIAAAPPATVEAVISEPSPVPVARTEFGVDIGGANSIDGLRAIWRGMARVRALEGLRPMMVVRERSNGLGMQLRLVAGPLTDAAAAAKICAALTESSVACDTATFEGQRLALKAETAPAPAAVTGSPQGKPVQRKRATPKSQEQRTEQAPKPPEEAAAPKPQSSLTSFLGIR